MTSGRIIANLPSRDFDTTEQFYGTLGFRTTYRGDDRIILNRNGMQVEFFPRPALDPSKCWFSACMRPFDIDALLTEWRELGIWAEGDALPRMGVQPLEPGRDAPRMFVLLDPDGSLWRVLEAGGGE